MPRHDRAANALRLLGVVPPRSGRGVFKAWDDVTSFEGVRIAPHGTVTWGDDLELCPDAMYLRLTGKKAGDVFERLNRAEVDA